MTDPAHKAADRALEDIDRRIAATYGAALRDVQDRMSEFMATSKDEYYRNGDKVTFDGVRYVYNKNNVVVSPAENSKSWIRQD